MASKVSGFVELDARECRLKISPALKKIYDHMDKDRKREDKHFDSWRSGIVNKLDRGRLGRWWKWYWIPWNRFERKPFPGEFSSADDDKWRSFFQDSFGFWRWWDLYRTHDDEAKKEYEIAIAACKAAEKAGDGKVLISADSRRVMKLVS